MRLSHVDKEVKRCGFCFLVPVLSFDESVLIGYLIKLKCGYGENVDRTIGTLDCFRS
jgi:hypothetical protein